MIKIAILDDDSRMVDIVKKYVENESGVDVDTYVKATELLNSIQTGKKYDAVISDIEMPEVNGIEFGRELNYLYPEVYLVFLTGYRQYAVESYMLDAYQYILKEDLDVRLPQVIKKMIGKIKNEKKKFRMIGTPTNKVPIFYRNIIYIKKEKGTKYVKYATTIGDFKERIAINDLIAELASEEFVLVERSYIINVEHIETIKNNIISMINGEKIVISRRLIKHVKEKINSYRGNLEW